jgi:hypothetical protein
MSELKQGVRLDQWARHFPNVIADGGIKHPGRNASARTIRQSGYEHV